LAGSATVAAAQPPRQPGWRCIRLSCGRASAGTWDTSLLAPGDYVLRILATDFNGNVAIGNRDLTVAVVR